MALSPARSGAVAAVLMWASALTVSAQAVQPAQAGAGQLVQTKADGTVAVKAEGIRLITLLEAMQAVCVMDLRVDETQGARIVAVDLDGLSPSAAVNEILKASGADFGMNTKCGTAADPMRVVLRNGSTGPISARTRRVDPDDPAVKNAEMPPPLPGDPSIKPESHDENRAPGPVNVIGAGSGNQELAPGQVTGEQMLQMLAPQPRSTSPVIELPFTDANGQPYLAVRPPASNTVVLPFPDANGNLVEVPVPTGPKPTRVDFPVVNSKSSGTPSAPAQPGPQNPADTQKRPGGGSDR